MIERQGASFQLFPTFVEFRVGKADGVLAVQAALSTFQRTRTQLSKGIACSGECSLVKCILDLVKMKEMLHRSYAPQTYTCITKSAFCVLKIVLVAIRR